MVSSSRDFGVEQFFRADEFQADDPSPFSLHNSNKNYVTALSNFEIFKRKALKSIFLTGNETVKLFLLLQFSKDCS